MSVCPRAPEVIKTDYTNPGSVTATAPALKTLECGGLTTGILTPPGAVITQTICCPPNTVQVSGCGTRWEGSWASGANYNYESGTPICFTSWVTHNDVVYACKQAHTAAASTEPGIGAGWAGVWSLVVESGAGKMKWRGDWSASGVAYKENDVVRLPDDGNAYIAELDHTSSASNKPGEPTTTEWVPVTSVSGGSTLDPENQSFWDKLKNGVFDWINTATVGDWITALAAGAGIVYAGTKIVDMITGDGEGDGQADSRYNGTPGYNGAFTAPTLPVVVSSLMEFVGYTYQQYDVSLLPASPVHLTLTTQMNVRALLQQLSLVYQFDVISSSGVIKFIPKYQTSVRTLTSADLAHTTGDTSIAPYTAKRLQGIDLPRSVSIVYNSANLDYNAFVQTTTFETYAEGQDLKINVPLTLADADAHRIAETAMTNAHIEQQQYTFQTDYYNIDVEPGDILTLPLGSGVTTDVRVIEIREVDEGILEFTTSRSDMNTTSYEISDIETVLPPAQPSNQIAVLGYSQALFLEVPALSNTETQPRLKVAVHGYGKPGWPGATLYRSYDGVSYTPVLTTSKQCTIGMASTILSAPPDYHVWDTNSSLTVVLKQGTLSNSTDELVLNGANLCMVGEEVIAFVNATLTGPNTYVLTRLLRGRHGSEQKCGTHTTNELFVLLNNQLEDLPMTQQDLGKTTKWKCVTIGSDISKVNAEDVRPFGLNVRPWAVAQPDAIKQTNGDWVITWRERSKYNNGLQDYVEIPHDPDWMGYGLAFMVGSNIVYTATTTEMNYTLTSAQQTQYYGGPQTNLRVSITQMSSLVGGGYPTVIER